MVCKINFDYEIILSDENDSVCSSANSSVEISTKKFTLGDNIVNVNPLEIISVRRLNLCEQFSSSESIFQEEEEEQPDISCTSKIPMNFYLDYDESIGNFDDESIVESETDVYCNTSDDDDDDDDDNENKYFNAQQLSFKYELPIVNRFQLGSLQAIENSPSLNELTKYCVNEKYRRLQAKSVEKNINTESIDKSKYSEENSIGEKGYFSKKTSQKITENSIPPELLPNLPIDLLTEFINGQKSVTEIMSQINNKNSNKRKKMNKKSKRQKTNKKRKKHVNSNLSIPNSSKEDEPHFEMVNKESYIDAKPKHSCSQDIDASTTSFCNQNTTLLQLCSNENLLEIIDNCHNNEKCSTDCDVQIESTKSFNESPSSLEYEFAAVNEKKEKAAKITTVMLEKDAISNSPSIPEISSYNQNNGVSNDTDKVNNDAIGILCLVSKDNCLDNGTASTDSGFNDFDLCDQIDDCEQALVTNNIENSIPQPIDEVVIKDYSSDSAVSTPTTTQSVTINSRPNKKPLSIVPVENFIDLTSFKFKFINESTLNHLHSEDSVLNNDNETIIEETEGSGSEAFYCQPSETHSVEKPKSFDVEQSIKPSLSEFGKEPPIPNSNKIDWDLKENECENETEMDIVCPEMNVLDHPEGEIDEDTNDHQTESQRLQMNSNFHTKYYHCLYNSPKSLITNQTDMSLFLNYQWLKFCEKYTIHNLDL